VVALIYVIDDDPVTCDAIAAALGTEGHAVETFTHPRRALEAADDAPPAVAITDFSMPDLNGLELILALRRPAPDATFLVVSGQASVEDAVELMKHGVVDVMVKPPRARALRKAVAMALAQHELAAENRRLKQALRGKQGLERVVGGSPAFSEAIRQVEKVAGSPSTVLLTGETGTGKEVLAEAIHELSARADGRLIKVHCAAIPETLIESELFGHARGAFTGAVRTKPGVFEQADGGTLFLDEIGELPLSVQVKLLRALQSHAVQRIGETEERQIDVRVIAATNRDLEVAVSEGGFRSDLFYRLNVVAIRVPPLRARGDDVLLLARHFLALEARRAGREQLTGFSDDALEALERHDWPGNVRELQNAVARAVALGEGPMLGLEDLPDPVRNTGSADRPVLEIPTGITLAEAERVLILRTLEEENGDKREAAEKLGISLATLYRKLSQYEKEGRA
jgi:DNA-binding NtrC family response regulator